MYTFQKSQKAAHLEIKPILQKSSFKGFKKKRSPLAGFQGFMVNLFTDATSTFKQSLFNITLAPETWK